MRLILDVPDDLIQQLRDVAEMDRNDGIWVGQTVPDWAAERARRLGISAGSYLILSGPAFRLADLVLGEVVAGDERG